MVAKHPTISQEHTQGETTAESDKRSTTVEGKWTEHYMVPSLRRRSWRQRIAWSLVWIYICEYRPAVAPGAQTDRGLQSGGSGEDPWPTSRTRSARPAGDQGPAEEDQSPTTLATAYTEKRKPDQDKGVANGYLHSTNEGPHPSRKATAQGGIGGTPQRHRTSQVGHPEDQEWRHHGKPESDGHGPGRSPRFANPRRREDPAQGETTYCGEGQFGYAKTALQPTTTNGGVHAELPTTHCTHGGTCGHTTWSLHTGAECEIAGHQPGCSDCCCGHGRSAKGKRKAKWKDSRCPTALRNCEKGQGTEWSLRTASACAQGRWGDISVSPLEQNGSIVETLLQRSLQQRMNDQPGRLVRGALLWTIWTILWFGLVLSPKRWDRDGQGEVQVLDEQRQRRHSERKVRNHITGRWTLTRPFSVLLLLAAWTGCHASEDEQIRQWLHQRRLAMTLQATPAAGLAHRWQLLEDAHGLRRPPPRGHYDAAIARPQDDLRHTGNSFGLRIHHAAEPHGIETLILQHWADIRRDTSPHNQWRLHPMHGAAYTSSYFPTTHRHYLITTDWERHCRPRKRAIAVEITWHHARATERALVRPWMPDDEATVAFLEEIHLLQACTSTHRCHIHHNGVPAASRWMKFSHGDYVLVEAFKLEPPHDTDSEGELPMPISGVVSDDTSSWTSSYTSEETVDDLHLADTFMSDALIVYRPLGRTLRPPHLIQAMHTTNINNLVVVMQHWQDLRYHPWRIECVHPTYGADYPQSDETHIYVVVALCDLESPLHQVVLNVVQTLDTTLQRALPLPPYVERGEILRANRLQDFCQRPQHTCRVYKNGQLMTEGDRRTVSHGDYIRTTITNVLDEETESRMADSFQLSAQAEGLEQLDATGLAMLDNGRDGQPTIIDNRPRPSQSSSSRGPHEELTVDKAHHPPAHDRADYWIFMAAIMYSAAIFLGRRMYQSEVHGKIKRKQRRLNKTLSNAQTLRTLALVYLIVGADALAINERVGRHTDVTQADDSDLSFPPMCYVTMSKADYTVGREPLEGLPPPGNTLMEEDVEHTLTTSMSASFLQRSRTEITDAMVDRICLLFEGISLTKQIYEVQKTFWMHTSNSNEYQNADDLCGKLVPLTTQWRNKVNPFTEFADRSEAAAVRSTHPGSEKSFPVGQDSQEVETAEDGQLERRDHLDNRVTSDNAFFPEWCKTATLETPGAIAHALGIDNLVAPKDSNTPEFHFRVGPDVCNDDDGIFCQWSMPPMPTLTQLDDLHPTSLTSMTLSGSQRARIEDKENKYWHIYTDGSASRDPDHPSSAWAVIIYKSKDSTPTSDNVYIYDWFGGVTDIDPLSQQWIGAVQHDSKSAEASAITWALLFLLQTTGDNHAHIYCDPLTVLEAVKGRWNHQEDDYVIQRARATYMLAWTCLREKLSLSHIKGHSGHFGNELADAVAGNLRTGNLMERIPAICLSKWYHGSSPAILWAWAQLDADARPGQVMTCDKGELYWQHTDLPSEQLRWDSWRSRDTEESQHQQLHLLIASYNVGSLNDTNRCAFLREQAEWAGVHVLGLQETRARYESPGDSNFIRIIAVASEGQGGCELWLSRSKAFATVGGRPLLFERDHVHVGVATPELLIVRYEVSGLKLSFVVAHAPHSGHQAQHIDEWWKRLREQIGRFCLHTQSIILIDANADVHEEAPFTGDLLHINREKPRVGDRALMALLRQHSLWAPSSFSAHHDGQTSTWTANDATKTARSDFVLLPLEWWGFDVKSCILQELDSGVGGLDHVAVGVTVRGWFQSTTHEKAKWTWDRNKIPKATEETWNAFFADWPSVPWHLDTTSHAALLERHLQQRLQAFFPHDARRKRSNTQLSDETWMLFTTRNRLKKILHAHHKAWQHLILQNAFDAIAHRAGCQNVNARSVCYTLKIAATWKRHKETQMDIKRSLRHDRARYVATQMEEVAQQDHKQVLKILKPMRIGRRVQQLGRKPLPMIRLEDGSTAETFQSAQDRWRRHFAKMEGGSISTAPQLLQDQRQQQQGGSVQVEQLPTIFDLERQMMKAKAKKAMGPDGVPPEILKHAANHMSYHYWPLFAKISLTRQESLQYKGGKLVAAYKQRGATTDCGSYRALLVSSSLAKSFHSVYRKRSLRYVQQGAGQLQFTSHQSPSVGLAAHIVRLHQQAAQRHGRSSITLFLDIKEAFYCVIRQHSMPATFEDQDIFRFLHRMGVRDMHIQQVASLLAEGPTLEALGCDEHLLEIITEFHRGTWFHLATDAQGPLIKTEKGTRPGDGFADVLWALTFAKWLVRLEDKLANEGVLSQIDWNREANLHTSRGDNHIRKGIIAWADDVAVLADSADPLVVVDKLIYITEMLVRDLLAFGMTPNLERGKTEVVADIRGKGSHVVKRKLFNEDKGHVDINTDLEDKPKLRVVQKYKHLGGLIVHGGKIGPEIQHRIAQGRQACADYRTKIYGNSDIPLAHRLQVLKSTAITSATYNAGCWPRLNQKDTKLWTHGMLSLYRIALQKTMPHLDLRHLPDGGVLGLCQALHPMTELRILRLRHYAQYIRRHYPLLWALIAQEEQWKEQVQEDFQWLYDNIKGLTVHPHPHSELTYWTHMIQEQHGKWKGILRRVTLHAALQFRIHADVNLMHRRALRMLQTFGVAPSMKEDKECLYHYKCFICDVNFESYTGWAVHAFKKHGRTHPSRQVQEGRTCRACGKVFNNAARLTRHFKSVPSCASTVATHLDPIQVQPGFGSTVVAQEEAANALQIWMRSEAATLEPGDTWVTTPQTKQLHHLCRTEGWFAEEEASAAIMDFLQASPVSYGEIITVKEKLMDEELENQHVLQEALDGIAEQARAQVDLPHQQDAEIDGSLFLRHELKLPVKVERSPTVFRYILHVFSGVRREGDLHSALLAVTPPDGTTLFPISIDIVLSDRYCDLLDPKQQKKWLMWAQEGAIYMMIGGPPCETWSVSRLRWLDSHEGPRPVRDGDRLDDYIWGLPQLRIREARQVRVANSLLHFCILIFLAQVLTQGIAIIEHPDRAGQRGAITPPSIWILPVMQYIQSASSVFPLHIKQGYWDAKSPKPTVLLTTIPATCGKEIMECLEGFQVRSSLPPPLRMGRNERNIYRTAALKRYPKALCQAIAGVAVKFISKVTYTACSDDNINQVAKMLRGVYQTSDDCLDDGGDYAGDRN